MLEKLVKGRYLDFVDPKPKLTYLPGVLLEQPRIALTIAQSEKVTLEVKKITDKGSFIKEKNVFVKTEQKQRFSTISMGENTAKVHRNFHWLGYYGGAVSYVQLDDTGVLSGPFSGCWMIVFKKDGATCVGHIGTVDLPNNQQTIAAKKAWNEFCSENQGCVLRGFNPARSWTGNKPPKIHGEDHPMVWGLVTRTKLISVLLYRNETKRERYRIVDWKEVDSSHMNELIRI